jgi:hypothetical protein
MKPSFRIEWISIIAPTVIASADDIAMNDAALPPASGATTANDMIDIVELAVIFRCRLVAKRVYAVIPSVA